MEAAGSLLTCPILVSIRFLPPLQHGLGPLSFRCQVDWPLAQKDRSAGPRLRREAGADTGEVASRCLESSYAETVVVASPLIVWPIECQFELSRGGGGNWALEAHSSRVTAC